MGEKNIMPECKVGHYKSNTILSRSPLVCIGGYGQDQCKHLEQCRKSLIADYDDWCRERKLEPIENNMRCWFGTYFVEKMKEMNSQNKGE